MSEPKKGTIDFKTLPGALAGGVAKLSKYTVLLFILFIAIIYGFVLYRVSTLSSAEPTSDAISTQAKTPHIDKKVVGRLKELKDNSVNVQTLFNDARNNPFHE